MSVPKGKQDTEIARLKAEIESLTLEKNLLKRIIGENESGIFVVQDHRIVFNNPHFCELTGYNILELEEILFLDLVHPKDRKLIKLLFQNDYQEIRQKQSNSFTFRILTKDNDLRWLKANVSITKWNSSPALLSTCYDITQQKEAEAKLIEEEQNFRLLVNTFEDLIFIVNRRGNIIQCNQAAINRLEYPEHELLLKPFASLHVCDPESDLNELIDRVFQSRKGAFASQIVSKGGVRILVETRLVKGIWSNKEVLFVISQDISERIEAEKSMKLSEEKFSKAFNTGAAMMTISTLEEGRYIDVNEAFLAKTGLTREETIGRASSELGIYPEIAKRSRLKAYLKVHGKISNRETRITSKKGERMVFLFSAEVINIQGTDCILIVMTDITQRKLIEEELVKSKAQLKGILDNLPFIAWLKDTRGRFLAVNKAFAKYYNMEERDIVGKTDFDFCPNSRAEHLRKSDLEVLKTKKQVFFEEKEEKGGETVWWENFKAPVLGRGNKIIATTGIARIITDQKRSQEQISQNLEQQKVLAEISYTFNSGIDFDQKINRVLQLIGNYMNVGRVYIFEDIDNGTMASNTYEWSHGLNPTQLSRPQTISYNECPSLRNQLKSKGYYMASNIDTLPDDTREWFKPQQVVSTLLYPLTVAGNSIGFIGFNEYQTPRQWHRNEIGFLKTVVNIISVGYERKISEDKIRLSEQRFRQFSELLPEMVFEADANHRITFTNNNLLRTFGFKSLDFQNGIFIEDLYVKEDQVQLTECLGAHRQLSNQPALELTARRRNKTTFPTLSHFNIVMSNGKVSRYIGVMVDITNRKKQELELIRAKVQAEEASKAKEQFLSTMSHEIRTPMNAVIGMTNLLLQESPKAEQMENLKALKFSAENLLALLNDILDFSKIEAGKIDLLDTDINLRAIAEGLQQSFGQMAREKGIELTCDYDSAIPANLTGDPVRVNQVLTNLIGNAIKFTMQGGVTLSMKLEKNLLKSVSVKFSIIDTGIGIRKEKQAIIFNEFTQVTDTNKRFGGTGLGLAISQRLVKLMGGEIAVRSKPGKGSTFFFTLKFNKVAPAVEPQPPATPTAKEFSVNKAYRVLIVEDNEINKIIAEKFLVKWGIQVDHAENGLVAVEKVSAGHYDLILMDLEMPVMSGYEATVAIRKMYDKSKSSVPIIAITASAMQDIQKKIFSLGMNDFILKPFNPNDLKAKLIQHLELQNTPQ